jgi:sigma-B regulation protein RsbU (phosphoserine phosphatase)
MEVTALPIFRDQLLDRRQKLETAVATLPGATDVTRLLQEVDAALRRMDAGTFGLCESCGDTVEAERLLADPLTRFCLDHLTSIEQRALEEDLDLASRIQRELLPKLEARPGGPGGPGGIVGWEIAYHYQAAGPVSGDYCDLIQGDAGETYFLVGDVAGHGVAAAMLMSHLSATLRTLISLGLPLSQLMERASRIFCESTLPTQYATLVCGRASLSGEIEVCNAGHPPPLVIRTSGPGGPDGIVRLDATGLPIGMFCSESFPSQIVQLDRGETLLLYTDGLLETQNSSGDEYGIERLLTLAASATALKPQAIVDRCVGNLASYRGTATSTDDLTVMAVRRL